MAIELMSLEEIQQLDKRAIELPVETFSLSRKNMLALLDTARAAHEYKAHYEFMCQIKETLEGELKLANEALEKARSEERERCAKLAESYLNYELKFEGLAKDIRDLK